MATDQTSPTIAFHVTLATHQGRGIVEKRPVSTGAAEQLRNEIETLRAIRHPQVVEVVEDLTEGGGQPRLATWLAGRQTLATHQQGEPPQLAGLGVQLATLVDELHSLGWVHGGLDADHVIVDRGGRLVLCSFGRAARIQPGDPRIEADRVAVVETLVDLAGPELDRSGVLRVLERARRTPIPLSRLAAELAAFIGEDTRSSRRTRSPRRTPSPQRQRAQSDRRRPGRLPLGALGRLALCAAALVVLGSALGPFSLSDPVDAARAVLTWVALGLAAYGIVANLAVLIAHLSGAAWWAGVVQRLAPPKLLWIATGVATVGALTAPRRPADGPAAATTARAPLTTAPRSASPDDPVPKASSDPSPDQAVATTAPPSPLPPPEPTPPPLDPSTIAPPAPPGTATTWTVQPGDHLWRIAERTLAAAWGREPTDAEIDPYWRDLIDLNRKRLRDAANPDRIFPGQVFELPPVPAPPR
jgi:hypothetical protein